MINEATKEAILMPVYLTDPDLEERLKAERAATGGDRYDEVWEGVTFMPPLANNQHQSLGFEFAVVIHYALGDRLRGRIFPGVNVSDREDDWESNYRCPDVAVFLPGCPARDCGTHWFGGPDFASEILSMGDRTLEKLPFYAAIGVRELLIIDRYPWSLELYRLTQGQLLSVGKSDLEHTTPLVSAVLPLSFGLLAGVPRPRIEVIHQDGKQRWIV
jgi:Uma2 family endonuclease